MSYLSKNILAKTTTTTTIIYSVKQYKTIKEKHYVKIDLYHYSSIRLTKNKKKL